MRRVLRMLQKNKTNERGNEVTATVHKLVPKDAQKDLLSAFEDDLTWFLNTPEFKSWVGEMSVRYRRDKANSTGVQLKVVSEV